MIKEDLFVAAELRPDERGKSLPQYGFVEPADVRVMLKQQREA